MTCNRPGCDAPAGRSSRMCNKHQREYMRGWRDKHPTYMRDYMRTYEYSPEALEKRREYHKAYEAQRRASRTPRIVVPAAERPCCEPECDAPRYQTPTTTYVRCEAHQKQRTRAEKHRSDRRELDRRYREAHREQRREQSRAYAKANPSQVIAGSQARRARKRGAFVETVRPHVVFERDGWRCGLCKRSIPKRARHPDPKSASLDHIVPLSQGGRHEYRNVQAAHLHCNLSKSARVWHDGEQLRLVG